MSPPDRTIPRKPMARAARVTLFEREIRERLSEPATELLLSHASLISEGECAGGASRPSQPAQPGPYFGSTMLTIDLAALAGAVREVCDAASAHKLATLVRRDTRFIARVRKLAQREASRVVGIPVRAADADVRVRAQGSRVFIDVDVEGETQPAAGASGPR